MIEFRLLFSRFKNYCWKFFMFFMAAGPALDATVFETVAILYALQPNWWPGTGPESVSAPIQEIFDNTKNYEERYAEFNKVGTDFYGETVSKELDNMSLPPLSIPSKRSEPPKIVFKKSKTRKQEIQKLRTLYGRVRITAFSDGSRSYELFNVSPCRPCHRDTNDCDGVFVIGKPN